MSGVVAAERPVDESVGSSYRDLDWALRVLLDVKKLLKVYRVLSMYLGFGDCLVEVFVVEGLDVA